MAKEFVGPQISSLVFSPTTRRQKSTAAACKFGFLDLGHHRAHRLKLPPDPPTLASRRPQAILLNPRFPPPLLASDDFPATASAPLFPAKLSLLRLKTTLSSVMPRPEFTLTSQ